MRSGLSSTCSSRCTAPLTSMLPTPGAPCRRFTTSVSARSETSRSVRASERIDRYSTGWSLSLSARETVGSPMSRLKPRRASATLSRTSWIAVLMSTLSSNSATTHELPCEDPERIVRMPLTVFTASSMGRVTSCSTASAEAPG